MRHFNAEKRLMSIKRISPSHHYVISQYALALRTNSDLKDLILLAPQAPPKYAFEYAVNDPHAGNRFGHSEARDGYKTSGEYFVHLPDGRVQTVTYHADETGYYPTVHYKGAAVYPIAPAYHAPVPTYHAPVPTYHAPVSGHH
nr:cuticle protein 8-like [Penaeus vannamei]